MPAHEIEAPGCYPRNQSKVQLDVESKEKINSRLEVVNHRERDITARMTLAEAVSQGLSQPTGQKTLPCQFLYDERGSQLFEEITELPEYYLTRCEYGLLESHAKEISQSFSEKDALLVELGSGSSTKTRVLLDAFIQNQGEVEYVPIDISKSILVQSSSTLLNDYNDKLKIIANNGLYQQGLAYLSSEFSTKNKLVCFLGSSIGNFNKADAAKFLLEINHLLLPSDKLLIGIDLRKSKSILEPAYDDAQKVTADFNLNLLDRINSELNANFDRSKFEHVAQFDEKEGKVEMRIKSREKQTVEIKAINLVIEFQENETIHSENSHKYSVQEINRLAKDSQFSIEHWWSDGMFSLSLWSPYDASRDRTCDVYRDQLCSGWTFSDKIFSLLQPDAFLEQPITLRHPFLFYLGHLAAFAHNHLHNYLLQKPSFHPDFDELFERGIDPDVDDPNQCHAHPAVPPEWPGETAVRAYQLQVRHQVLNDLPELPRHSLMAPRVTAMIQEHDLMHAETLLYMTLLLPPLSRRPLDSADKNYVIQESTIPKHRMIMIPSGKAKLGANFNEIPWGWDNEFPEQEVEVPAFAIDELPVTNADFLEFMVAGYHLPQYWTPADWAWKCKTQLEHPNVWKKKNGEWYYRTVFDEILLDRVKDWPVYVSHAEASAYARWIGKKLPTEAEYHRAACGDLPLPPWGSVPQPGIHGNFNLWSWAPTPVGHFPKGKSAYGVLDMWGNGWEWTCTTFEGFKGFEAWIPEYPGYSQDFFDGVHYVLLGGSWATGSPLLRKSFRNWFQGRYPYPFSKFRCVAAPTIGPSESC